ncbi:hypothetical protein VHEMI09221 [[Torrubiella] hemipterigena]|uniref:Peptidase M3A/M3B catalytic domain-containing protein n=1 Tax=[Torrubiella] hemipterigena TaxID=1531966 RepID=A0A0A1TPN7_9HYPO|nr:hypothetical protein VHEMI09221 [[Torrubiella] hemipterigena]
MALHDPESEAVLDALNIASLYNSLRLSTCLQDGGEVETKTDDWAYGHCISTHLVGPYSAGYYGYLWSRAYSNCTFSTFTQNPMDGALGCKYGRCVLEHGGRRDETDMIAEFLGKRPNTEDLF